MSTCTHDQVPNGIYILDCKYYQKIGEAWDHETKDFKVLYKPLYSCPSKPGSYEAHHLATSTFERWNRKFRFVSDDELESLPEGVKSYVVPAESIRDVSAGNDSLSLLTTPLHPSVLKGSAKVTTIVEDFPAPTPPPLPSESLLTCTSAESLPTCRSDSGFGSRSLTSYFTMDFSMEFQQLIREGKKRATTRVLKPGVENGEPELHKMVNALMHHNDSAGSSEKKDIIARAVSDEDEHNPTQVFAMIRVTSVETMAFSDLTPGIAQIENFSTVDDLKLCLRQFYPWIQDADEVHIFYFEVI